MIDTVVMWPQFVSLGGFAFTAADLPQFLLQNSYDFSVPINLSLTVLIIQNETYKIREYN